MTAVRRYDQGEIRSTVETEEGFLKVDCVVTRTGVFTYRNADGSLIRELRHPDDVFRLDSLRTLKMLPITNDHPQSVFVTAENAKELSVGYTGEDVRPDGEFIITPLKVTDSQAVNAVKNGKQGLSLGYELVLVAEDGEYKGERYDFRQTKIRYNHLAIVANPRAGDEARIHLDENDAVQEIGKKKKNTDSTTKRSHPMIKMNLDGLEYEAAPEVAKAFEKTSKNLDEAVSQVNSLTEENTKLQANLDAANEELKKLKNVDSAAEIQKAVKARLELVSKASKHLDEETVKNIDGMSDKDIKIAVIKAHYPEANMDGKDDVYVDARFDGAVELQVEKKDPMAQQRKDASDASKNNDEMNQDKARERMQQRNLDAWKSEQK